MSDNTAKDQIDIAELAATLKDKLQLGVPRPDVLESLTPNVRKRVEALKELQGQHDGLEAKFFEERAALEAKYQKLYEPLYAKRYEIVNGVVEVEGVTNETTKEEGEEKAPEEKGVPNFWLTAMKTHEILEEVITENDEEALKYLKDIRWARIDNPKGFRLEFFFATNPYFKNEVLTKTYHMIDEDEPILEKAIGTEIEWYPGKCLTQKILQKRPKKGSKGGKPIKPVIKTENCESFFNFFKPPEVPEDDDDLDEDAAEELQALMEQDYEIGSAIRDKIIPHAVSWFTGEAAEEDGFELADDEDDEEDDEDEDEDEDEEDEDEEEEEEETKNKKKTSARSKKGGRPRPGQDQAGERPPECKQQ